MKHRNDIEDLETQIYHREAPKRKKKQWSMEQERLNTYRIINRLFLVL